MKRLLTAYWSAPYHPARALLLERGLYSLLALDALLLMLEHGARYGVGRFNVAHFVWLDRLAPLPSPALYVGLVTATALLALCAAQGALSRVGRVVLVGVYTTSWAISLHDSYQHHYLLSWLLAFSLGLPRVQAADCRDVDARVRGPGLALTAVSCAIVYAFTAVSKSEPLWRSGAVLRHLATSPGPFALLAEVERAGYPHVYRLAALGVLSLQVLIALGYLSVPFRDRRPNRALREGRWTPRAPTVFGTIGWFASLSFHLLTELDTGFAIGWFSFYMLWIGAVSFAPVPWIAAFVRAWGRLLPPWSPASLPRAAIALWVASATVAIWLGLRADLPGFAPAVWLVWAGLTVGTAMQAVRGRWNAAWRSALGGLLSVVCTAAVLQWTDVRFDYYRRGAGELLRMGRRHEALAEYQKAQQYAPASKSRAHIIHELEESLSEQRGK